ncbi:MAG: dynamin family protein [Gallionella sp.]|nr:dynamin family protein [Gallionella sp.]
MHEQNIETLRDEALRLVALEINVLQKMMGELGVLTEGKSGEKQTFDRTSAQKHIEVLAGEHKKLNELEMVLAVVGTMKAGKSTSINAIVGTEVLPNRNRPMTALPTLIRHTTGQIEPILKFDNDRPIHTLMGLLRNSLKKPENAAAIKELVIDSDMKEIITLIKNGEKFKTRYQGADEIFLFLRGLNDLVRLSRALEIDFPFSDYDEIHELPVIEVEFAHLREMAQAKGRLTLLDTPGPNESGQPHLKKMLREQLSKASAVLAILDFTQLKSEADEEVRKELSEIASVTKGRLYTLVNKFDQKDRHGDTEEEVKSFVAGSLMAGSISSDNVFPVSSRWAYLANRARHELHVNKKLPDAIKHPWISDFGEEAFGRRWESKIHDLAEVKASADALWKDSLFHAPLEKVIRTAHIRAAIYAVDSSAAKLVDMAEKMQNLLNTRATALGKSADELERQIKNLKQDIDRVESIEVEAKLNADTKLKKLTKGTELVFGGVKTHIAEALSAYFKEGKQLEKRAIDSKKAEEKKQELTKPVGSAGIFASLMGKLGKIRYSISTDMDFDPDDPVMKFDKRNDAEKLINKIQKSISGIFENAESVMQLGMTEVLAAFQVDFKNDVVRETEKILSEMKSRFEKDGFAMELRIPNTSKLALGFSGADMLGDIVSERQKTVTRNRRQSGAWGKVCGWFSTDDWGWEDYKTTEQFYEIDIRNIQNAANRSVDQAVDGLAEAVGIYIKKPLNDGINDFFAGFKESVEQIRGDLMQGIRDQEKSKVEQHELILKLSALKKNVPDILTDSRELKKDVEQYGTLAV